MIFECQDSSEGRLSVAVSVPIRHPGSPPDQTKEKTDLASAPDSPAITALSSKTGNGDRERARLSVTTSRGLYEQRRAATPDCRTVH